MITTPTGATVTVMRPSESNNACPTIDGDIKCDKCKGISVSGDSSCNVIVDGNIEAKGATGTIDISKAIVHGNIEAKDVIGNTIDISNTNVKGDIKIEERVLVTFTVTDNTVPSDKQVLIKKNTAMDVSIGPNANAKNVRLDENDFNGMLSCAIQSEGGGGGIQMAGTNHDR